MGLEWELDADSPYHPLNGETGATFGFATPSSILGSKLRAWFDPFDVSKFVLSGAVVLSWIDRVAALTVTQSTPSLQPLRVVGASGINRRPAVYFDGGDGLTKIGSTGLPVGTAARGLYSVYKPGRTTLSNVVAQQGLNAASARFSLQFRASPVGDPYFTGWSMDLSSGDAVTLDIKTACVHWVGNGGLMRIYKNGVKKAELARTINTTTDNLYIGSGPGVEQMLGLLGDIMFTDGTETDEQIAQLAGWKHWRYGLQPLLPGGHAYKYVRPLAA